MFYFLKGPPWNERKGHWPSGENVLDSESILITAPGSEAQEGGEKAEKSSAATARRGANETGEEGSRKARKGLMGLARASRVMVNKIRAKARDKLFKYPQGRVDK